MTNVDDRKQAREFFETWIGSRGPKGWLGRYLSNTGRWYTDMLIKEGEVRKSDRVLDVGCGSASLIIGLLQRVDLEHPVHGLEPTGAQFRLAEMKIEQAGLGSKVILEQGFAAPLPFDDDEFDLVYASFVFKHMADATLSESLAEIFRVLRSGGRFLGWEFAEIKAGFLENRAAAPGRSMRLRDFAQIYRFLEAAAFSEIAEFGVPNRGFWDPVQNVGIKAVKRSTSA